MSGYLSIEVDHVRDAWNACPAGEPGKGIGEQSNVELKHARRIALVHVPQEWPHGVVCRNDHSLFPCPPVLWAYGVLRSLRWELWDLFDLLESVQAGEAP